MPLPRLANPFGGFWAGLTSRERNLILVLVLTFFVMGTLVLLYLRSNYVRDARERIDEMKQAIDLLHTRGAVYQESLRAKKAREATISDDPILFSTLLEEASTIADGVTISNQEEQPTTDVGGGLSRRSVTFDLRSITVEQLTKFLAAVESKPGHVISTQRLLVRSPSISEDRLNVEVEVATWERGTTDAEKASP